MGGKLSHISESPDTPPKSWSGLLLFLEVQLQKQKAKASGSTSSMSSHVSSSDRPLLPTIGIVCVP